MLYNIDRKLNVLPEEMKHFNKFSQGMIQLLLLFLIYLRSVHFLITRSGLRKFLILKLNILSTKATDPISVQSGISTDLRN